MRFQSEKEYFDNFPYDETVVRNFLKSLKKRGFYKEVDIDNTPLIDMLSSPEGRGPRIISITKDKGIHYSSIYPLHEGETSMFKHEVNEGETYITFNTMRAMAGDCSTYVIKDGEIIGCYLLAIS